MTAPPLAARLARVKGERLYARDHRARDMGWPDAMLHAVLLRATRVDAPFTGLDLAALRGAPGLWWPPVTAADLARDKVENPSRDKGYIPGVNKRNSFGRMLVPAGERAEMYGQPVALVFFDHVRQVADFVESGLFSSAVGYGAPVPDPGPEPAPYASYHLIRYPGRGTGDDRFSYVLKGDHDPTAIGPDVPPEKRAVNLLALEARRRIERDIARHADAPGARRPEWSCLDLTFHTPSSDPMFMEPEAGIGWWEEVTRTLHLVLATQSPFKDVSNVKALCAAPDGAFKDLKVDLQTCPPGGGFGGRDESSFPLYLALAALYARGRPVRLAYDRFEQFLTGIKRHASVVRNRLFFTASGDLQALQSEITMDGGGEANLTAPVLQLASLQAAG
ncbi:MAG TPA: molybdopterin cofactor-binding domain-containing protein, partial [Myxococcaceae bacterium]